MISKLIDLVNVVMVTFGILFFVINLYYMSYRRSKKKSIWLNLILCIIMIIFFGYYLYEIFLAPVEPLP